MTATIPTFPRRETVRSLGATARDISVHRWGERFTRIHVDPLIAELDALATDESLSETEFRDEVWQVGWRAKREHTWCSKFDTLLTAFGFTEVLPFFEGRPVVRLGELPEGAVVAKRRLSTLSWGIWQRRGTWRLVMGTYGDVPLVGVCRVLHTEGPMWVRACDPVTTEAAPIGTTMSEGDGAPVYVKGTDGLWRAPGVVHKDGSTGWPGIRHPLPHMGFTSFGDR